jgi:hypothetical protein
MRSWWTRYWPPAIGRCRPRSIEFLCLLTCPEGIYTPHRELNDQGYILP